MRASAITLLTASLLAGCGTEPKGTSQHASVGPADYGPAATFRLPNVAGGWFALAASRNETTVLAFVASDCREACPIIEAVLRSVAQTYRRSGRLGRDVRIVTVEVDPVTNTRADVERLRHRLWPYDGWSFVRGTPVQTQSVLQRYGITVAPRVKDNDVKHATWVFVIDANLRERFLLAPSVNLTPLELERDIESAGSGRQSA